MVISDPIYISSDEETTSSEMERPKEHRIRQGRASSRPRSRAKSVDLRSPKQVQAIKRSSSAPSLSAIIARTNACTSDTIEAQSTPVAADPHPPIEALHFPERYASTLCGETPIRTDGLTVRGGIQATSMHTTIDISDANEPLNSCTRSDSANKISAVSQTNQPLNLLKRKVDPGATQSHKRPRTKAPTYIPRHLPYHPPVNSAQPAHVRHQAPYYSSNPSTQLHNSPLNPTLWAVPAYDPMTETTSTTKPSKAVLPRNRTPAGREQHLIDTGPKIRKTAWTCGMIADLATELQSAFDSQAFSTKHGVDVSEVLKVFAVYVYQPLFAFSAKGVSRAKMREFKENMKEHEQRLREIAVTGSEGKGRKTHGERSKPEGQGLRLPGKSAGAKGSVGSGKLATASKDDCMGC